MSNLFYNFYSLNFQVNFYTVVLLFCKSLCLSFILFFWKFQFNLSCSSIFQAADAWSAMGGF